MTLPLFDRNQGNIGAAQERAYQAQDELNAVHIRLKSELSQAHMRLRTARQQFELLRNVCSPVPKALMKLPARGSNLENSRSLTYWMLNARFSKPDLSNLSALSQANQAAAEISRIVGDGSAVITSATQP